jgi:formylglycine-generating enzyme required for sulfatase activity
MVKCPKCELVNPEHARVCAKCETALPVRDLKPDEMLMPGVPKAVKVVRLGEVPPDAVVRGIQVEEWERLERELDREREKRERAEASLEESKHEATERGYDTERLQVQLSLFRRLINKTSLGIAAGVIFVGFLLIIIGFAGKAAVERELAAHRVYKSKYDSVRVIVRGMKSELDSIKMAFINLSEEFAALHSETAHRPAARAAGQNNNRRTVNIDIAMVPVQGGTFRMGCTPEQGNDCGEDEKPVRSVTVNSFSIGKYPVTQGLWRQVMGSNPSQHRGDDLPVERVNWREAQDFIRTLNQMTGMRYRLPTEAEWEYAARGGAGSRGHKFAGSGQIHEVAWYSRSNGTVAVGTKRANELGLHDMSGNVLEWVSDRYGIYDETNVSNPTGPDDGNERVLRGGSWSSGSRACRVSARANMPSGARGNHIGFRLALSR